MKLLSKIERIAVLLFIAIGTTLLIGHLIAAVLRIFGLSSLSQFLYLLDFVVLFLILGYFWKKWAHSKLVLVTGIFIMLISLSLIALPPARLPFPAKIVAFQLFIVFVPLVLLLPILGPIVLIYAYFRGLLKDQRQLPISQSQSSFLQAPESPEVLAANKRKIKMKNYLSLAVGIVVLLILASPIYFILHSGQRDNILKDDPHVGRIVSFNLPLAYSSDCVGCDGSKRALEINRRLECIEDIDSVSARLYKDEFYNVSYVPSDMKFEVIEVIDVKSYGMQQIGSSGYTLAVLKDTNGLLSTELLSSLDDDGPCCNRMTSHLEKLFRYIEKNGKARVLATVYDLHSNKSDTVTQQFVLNALNSAPSKYRFSNPEVMASSIPGMLGIAVDVDADSLVYLVASRLNYKIWEITGLDADYLSALTQSEISRMRRSPINSR
ncbi:MAG: hypothetical protein AYP45_09375 [Candidatus Brocadia carolinensis]|uniref:Uncharacterized protein n=1 Tax=Candidatus Brocadia carolinensis TaxID=1004156 RepID=A0A1V4ATG1_9BACT|nr:MAG: hypothetical protein AYP45_09375 [Candidatus Brocadia caroliniensis]